MSASLAGIRVLDLGQIYQGPYAGFLLAKAGADVIKVEAPHGEAGRLRAPPGKITSFPMAMLNANKRAITLNLKTRGGQDLLKRLVPHFDVLVENYSPGVMERFGVGHEVLQGINPRLIYASGTGYGLSGPNRDSLAMDLTVQAISGVMSINGFPDGPPVRIGPPVVDFLSGTHLYAGIVTALIERERSGRGRLVEIAMQEAIYPTLASNLGLFYDSHYTRIPPRTGNFHGGLGISPHNVFETLDGYVALQCTVEHHWPKLLEAMAREDLKDDPRFVDNTARLANFEETDAVVAAWTAQKTKDEVFEICRRQKVPCAPVRDLVEAMNDPHLHGRGMLEWIEHPELGRIVVPNSPIRVHDTDVPEATPSPGLGEHNEQVYGEVLHLSPDEVGMLKQAGDI